MKVIFAQGNPGLDYEKTRHNVAWRVLSVYSADFIEKSKFHALIAETTIAGEKVLLVLPTTYYNETGISLRAIIDFYKIETSSDVLVLHDELALPFGTLRIRHGGRDAGNNGIKSLNAHIGEGYYRIRIGIANDQRGRMNDSDFVLSKFSSNEETKLVAGIIPHTRVLIEQFVSGTLEHTSHSL